MVDSSATYSLPILVNQHLPREVAILDVLTDKNNTPIDLYFVGASSVVGQLLGIHPDRLRNKRYTDLFDAADFDGLFNRCLTVFRSGQPQQFKAISPDFDGVAHTYAVQIDRADGQIRLTCTDESSLPEPVLPQSISVDVLNTLTDALCLLDDIADATDTGDFSYRFANAAFTGTWGSPASALPGGSYRSSAVHKAQPELLTHLRAVALTGISYEGEYWIDNGTPTSWYVVQISRTSVGSLVMTLHNSSTIHDVLKRAEAQNHSLQEAITNLERSNMDLAQFAQVASHDLQEPLRKIQVFSDLLQNQLGDSLSEGERDLSKRLQLAAQRMQHMIRDLMNYSRLTSDKASFVPIDLNAVLADVQADLDVLITDKQAVVDVTALPTVSGNSSRLRQLFQNLIANALKFQPADQTPVIQISSRLVDGNALPASLANQPRRRYHLIAVTDNGIGFDVEKYRSKLFRLFQRLHERRAYEGTGIGLAVAQRVAESHGGAVDVKSTPGQGSTFEVYLPA